MSTPAKLEWIVEYSLREKLGHGIGLVRVNADTRLEARDEFYRLNDPGQHVVLVITPVEAPAP